MTDYRHFVSFIRYIMSTFSLTFNLQKTLLTKNGIKPNRNSAIEHDSPTEKVSCRVEVFIKIKFYIC